MTIDPEKRLIENLAAISPQRELAEVAKECDIVFARYRQVVRLPQRFRTLTPFGGTLQSYVKVDPNLKDQYITPENVNQELLYMVRTFDKIKEIQNTTDSLNGIVYDGVKLHFKSITLSAYDKPENQKYLDEDTKKLIAKSACKFLIRYNS